MKEYLYVSLYKAFPEEYEEDPLILVSEKYRYYPIYAICYNIYAYLHNIIESKSYSI